MRYRTYLIFGPPGSGKGTQGKILGAIPRFFHCACGVAAECSGVLIDRFRMGLRQQMIVERPPRPKFRCGVMAIVRASGKVALGDAIIVEFPTQPWQALPAL